MIRILITGVFLLLILIQVASAQPYTGNLSGRILDEQGQPIPDAQIKIEELDRGGFTGPEGKFLIEDVPEGVYTLVITHLGFTSKQIPAVTVTGRGTTTVETIQLAEKIVALEGTIVTATRTEKNLNDISTAANVLTADAIRIRNSKTSAEALREETGVFVQKTNHGGGSAIIRGLSSNQILLMVDGIRLNNSTYRLGNHQYLTTVDNNMLDRIEVVRGPTSVLHGSDALGGTVNLITRRPPVSESGKSIDYNVRVFGRHATADGENMARGEVAVFNHKIALLGGFSAKKFDDLRRGGNSSHPELENSTNGLLQTPSGFSAYDFDSKLFYEIDPKQQLLLAIQSSRQKEVPRYDKYESGKNVLWLYDPQERDLAYLQYLNDVNAGLASNLRLTLSYNRQKEGRITQSDVDSDINTERDNVKTIGLHAQLNRNLNHHVLTYGADFYADDVASTRSISDASGEIISEGLRGRFPDGAGYRSLGIFAQDEIYLSEHFITTLGLRYSYFNTEFDVAASPSTETGLNTVKQNFNALTGSLGLLYKMNQALSISANAAQAFRAPNLSDLSKLGESKGATFEVPNTNLEPEKMLSFDLGIRIHTPTFHASVVGYYAAISDLLASADATFNGAPEIIVGGDTLKVKHKENIGNAFITGVESAFQYQFNRSLNGYFNLTYTYGQNTTGDEPVGGIPPLFGLAGIRWQQDRFQAEVFARFAAKQDRLSADDLDDTRIPEGGTPAWQTVNLRAGVDIFRGTYLQLSLENIFDVNYREHGSGINGAGRNFIIQFEFRR